MMKLSDLVEFCQAEALAAKLVPDDASIWRKICRDYSKKFMTPLTEVHKLSPEFVLTSIYEEQLDAQNVDEALEDLLDAVYTLEDPEYEAEKEQQLSDFIDTIEAEEEERVKKGKPIHPGMKEESTLVPKTEQKKELPTSGYLNLSYLEDEEK